MASVAAAAPFPTAIANATTDVAAARYFHCYHYHYYHYYHCYHKNYLLLLILCTYFLCNSDVYF